MPPHRLHLQGPKKEALPAPRGGLRLAPSKPRGLRVAWRGLLGPGEG